MSSIKVVDINNEEAKQEEAIEQSIEEDLKLANSSHELCVKEEVNEVTEVVEEPPQETHEVIEEVKEESKPVKAQDVKPCVKAQDKMVRCPKCNKEINSQTLDTVINKDVREVLKTNQLNPTPRLEQNLSLNK